MKLTTKEKFRVRIAKDVLEWLDARVLEAYHGRYYLTPLRARKGIEPDDPQYYTPERCRVCAIGAVFCATVDRHNKLRLRDVDFVGRGNNTNGCNEPSDETMRSYLQKMGFDRRQLALIEIAFEMHDMMYDANTVAIDRAIYFGSRYITADSRMRAIMNNIIDNRGTFKP